MTKSPKKTSEMKFPPKRSKDVPATQGMIYAVRNELKSEFSSIKHKLSSHDQNFLSIESRFAAVDKKFDQV